MTDIVKITCPICSEGKIEIPRSLQRSNRRISKDVIGKRMCIQLLYQEGYSIREIQKMLNYKSTSSVHKIIIELQLKRANDKQ